MNYIQQITPNCNFTLKVKQKLLKGGFLWFLGLKENSKFLKSNPSKLVCESIWELAGFFTIFADRSLMSNKMGQKLAKHVPLGKHIMD